MYCNRGLIVKNNLCRTAGSPVCSDPVSKLPCNKLLYFVDLYVSFFSLKIPSHYSGHYTFATLLDITQLIDHWTLSKEHLITYHYTSSLLFKIKTPRFFSKLFLARRHVICYLTTRLWTHWGQFLPFSWSITWSHLYFETWVFLGPGMGTLGTTQEFMHVRFLLFKLI